MNNKKVSLDNTVLDLLNSSYPTKGSLPRKRSQGFVTRSYAGDEPVRTSAWEAMRKANSLIGNYIAP